MIDIRHQVIYGILAIVLIFFVVAFVKAYDHPSAPSSIDHILR